MSAIRKIIDSLSEKEVRDLLEEAAQNSDYVADRLSELRPEANRANADFFMGRARSAVWDAFNEENDESKTDHYGFLSFENTAWAIKREVRELLKAGLDDKALELIEECENDMPQEFCGECEDDIDSVIWACKEARGIVIENGGKAAREKLFELFSRRLEDEEILDDNLRDRFNSKAFLPRKYALIETMIEKLRAKGELGSRAGQDCLCLMLDLMSRTKKSIEEIRAFEDLYVDSGSSFNNLVKEHRLKRGETGSAIAMLEQKEKTPALYRELIKLYEKEKNFPKAAEALRALILLTYGGYSENSGDLPHLYNISKSDEWEPFAVTLLTRKDLRYGHKIFILHSLGKTQELADALLNITDNDLRQIHLSRWENRHRNFDPAWRALMLTYSTDLLFAGYGPQILKACDTYLSYLENCMNPDLYDEGVEALTALRQIDGAAPLCEEAAKRWRVTLKRKRKLMELMNAHGL